MIQNEQIVFYVVRTLMSHLTAIRKCALNVIKLGIKQETVQKKILKAVQNVKV